MRGDSKNWRDQKDYRSDYFRDNVGVLGRIWVCSQCGKPLWGKHNVQVDHIFAPSVVAREHVDRDGTKYKTSVLAEALNNNFNLGAICPKCNLAKSNKVGFVTTRGYAAKIVEVLVFNLQDALVLTIWGGGKSLSTAGRLFLPSSMKPKKKKPKSRAQIKKEMFNSPTAGFLAAMLFATTSLIYYTGWAAVKSVKKIVPAAGRAVMSPFKSKMPIYGKFVVAAAYAAGLYYIWSKVGG